MRINANATGTRTIEVNEEQLQTIRRYSLFERIATSIGTVDEESLEKLRCTVRSLIASQEDKALLTLALVLYDDNMKSTGLINLINLYNQWLAQQPTETEPVTDENNA